MKSIAGGMKFRDGGRSNTFFATLAALLVGAMLLWASPAGAQATEADLSITKSGPAQVEPGQNFNYVLTVSNATGAATATNVQVTDELPAGVTLVEADPDICTVPTPDPDGDGRQNVTCTVGDLAAGASQTITLTVMAPGVPRDIVNRARASSGSDPDSPVTSNEVITRVAPDLVINKLDTPDPIDTEGRLIYTLRVENQGSTTATDVRVRDELPIDVLNFIDVESGTFDCQYSAGIVRCTGGTIAPGEVGAVRIIVEPEEAGTIQNTGAVFVDGIRGPIDTDTEETVVRGDAAPDPDPDPTDPDPDPTDPDPDPTDPDPTDPDPTTGDGCSPVVDTETEEPIGVLRGSEDLFFQYTNDESQTLPLRIVYATSSADGTLTITVTPEGGGEAILEETIAGADLGVLTVDTEANTTYDIEVLPEDQGYAVLFEVGRGEEECTGPKSLDPAADPSDDPQDDVVDEVDNDEDTLADTGGVPLGGVVPLAGALLLVVSLATVRGLVRR